MLLLKLCAFGRAEKLLKWKVAVALESSKEVLFLGRVCSHIYRVFKNLCHKLFLGIPHPKISKKVPINMGPKMNRFRDIDLRSCAGTLLSIT